MSVHGQNTIAIADAKENFVSIKESLSKIFQDINTMLQSKNDDGYLPYASNISNRNYYWIFSRRGYEILPRMQQTFKYSCMHCKNDKNDKG